MMLDLGLCLLCALTEDTALFFESEWVLYPAFASPPAPTTHPTSLPPPTPYRINP